MFSNLITLFVQTINNFEGEKYDLLFRRNNEKSFRNTPCTNDMSESIVGATKYEKRRSTQAHFDTIISTVQMKRNDVKNDFINLQSDNKESFDNIMDMITDESIKDLKVQQNNNKIALIEQQSCLLNDKIQKKKEQVEKLDEKNHKILDNELIYDKNEIDLKLKEYIDKNSKQERINFIKNQLKKFKLLYAKKYDNCPKIMFSKNRHVFDEKELKQILFDCIEWRNNLNINENDNENNEDIDNNKYGIDSLHYYKKRKLRDYYVELPDNKRIKTLTMPSV